MNRVNNPLSGTTILLGVSASIAAYKSVELARLLLLAGANVETCLSENAESFIGPETFRGLSGNIPYSKTYGSDASLGPEPHLSLAEKADLFVICPATASMLAKMAQGLANDPVSLTYLSYRGKTFAAPSMASEMWENPQTIETRTN